MITQLPPSGDALCAWCGKPAQRNRVFGTMDACCSEHYAMFFAQHAEHRSSMDMPSRAKS